MGRNDVRVDVRHSVVQIHTATATVRPVAAVATRNGVLDVCHSPSYIRMGRNDGREDRQHSVVQRHTVTATVRPVVVATTRKGVIA